MNRDSVFISYSHLDEKWLKEMKKPLSVLQHNHQMEIWDDSKIKVGSNWKNEIQNSIKKCKVGILLVSNNFLASDFIVKKELPDILKAARKEGLVIFNVIVDICAFHLTDLGVFQCLNNPKFPLEELSTKERKRVLVNLTDELLRVISESKKEFPNSGRTSNDDEDNSFCSLLVLALLVKKGDLPITFIQETLLIRRKIIVSSLELLRENGYVEKHQGIYNNKPSSLWKVLTPGIGVFNNFETIYNTITN